MGRLNQLHEATVLLGQRCIAFHPKLVLVTGRVTAGLMLSQAIYWTRKLAIAESTRQGWFWKTREEWRNETGLSRREQDSARQALKDLGLWLEKRVGMPAKVWYRIDLDTLGWLLEPTGYTAWDWRNDRAILQLLGRPFLFYRSLSDITGAATSAVLLSNFLGQERTRLKHGDALTGWRPYLFDALRQQTGLTRHELDSARSGLRQTEVLAERRLGMPPRVEWQIRLDRLIALLTAVDSRPTSANRVLRQPDQLAETGPVDRFSGNAPTSLQESGNPACGNPANLDAGILLAGFPETYRQDLRNRTDRIYGNAPASWAVSGALDGRLPENLYIDWTTGFKTTPPTEAIGLDDDGNRWFERLIWPKTLRPEERESAKRLLAPVSAQAQLLLDELAGQALAHKTIEQPLNYLSALVSKARAGDFIPAAALREQTRRQRIETERQAIAPATPIPPDERARHIQAGLNGLRTFMAQRMGQSRSCGGAND
jgi:hypothetical protein